jgi:hypothetical protein
MNMFAVKKTTDWKLLNGTSLQGYVNVDYATLVNVFGEPDEGDAYKTDANWSVTVNGTVCTIYNYKDGVNYLGSVRGKQKEYITDWHIGGRTLRSVKLVEGAISTYLAKQRQ